MDLYLMRGGAALIPGGAADRGMTVLNNGRDMVGGIELYYTSPIYINLDEERGLPAGCAMYYRNKDFHIPEIVKCMLGPLQSGQQHDLSFPITISEQAPPVQTFGVAIVRPVRSDVDSERNMVDNIATPGGAIALPPDQPDQAHSGDRPYMAVQSNTTIVSSTAPSDSGYRVLNLGTKMAEDARLVVVTPLYVNTSTAGELPAGCSMVLRDPDPAVPEIVECQAGNLDVDESREFSIPVKAIPGGPHRQVFGAAVAYAKRPKATGDAPARIPNGVYEDMAQSSANINHQ